MPDTLPSHDALRTATPTPIAQLCPDLSDPETRVVHGDVTITWPFSLVTNSIAFIVAEREFRLRRDKGQVRVKFHGAAAKAIAGASLGGGDEVRLSLKGVEWAKNESNTQIGGSTLEWQLEFTSCLTLLVRRAVSQEESVIDIERSNSQADVTNDHPDPSASLDEQPSTSDLAIPIPRSPERSISAERPASSFLESNEFMSPAFIKRARFSYGSLFEGLDIFDEGAERKKKKRKTSRFSLPANAWKYSSRSPSPEAESEPEEESNKPAGVAERCNGEDGTAKPAPETEDAPMSTPLRPAMVDGGCQTVESDLTPMRNVQVSAEPRHGPLAFPFGTPTPLPRPRISETANTVLDHAEQLHASLSEGHTPNELHNSFLGHSPAHGDTGMLFGFATAQPVTYPPPTPFSISRAEEPLHGHAHDFHVSEAYPTSFLDHSLQTADAEPHSILQSHDSHTEHDAPEQSGTPFDPGSHIFSSFEHARQRAHDAWSAGPPTSFPTTIASHDVDHPMEIPSSPSENGRVESKEIPSSPSEMTGLTFGRQQPAKIGVSTEDKSDAEPGHYQDGGDQPGDDYDLRNYDRAHDDDDEVDESEEEREFDPQDPDDQIMNPEEDADSEVEDEEEMGSDEEGVEYDSQGEGDVEGEFYSEEEEYDEEGHYETSAESEGDEVPPPPPAAPANPVVISLLSDSEDEDDEPEPEPELEPALQPPEETTTKEPEVEVPAESGELGEAEKVPTFAAGRESPAEPELSQEPGPTNEINEPAQTDGPVESRISVGLTLPEANESTLLEAKEPDVPEVEETAPPETEDTAMLEVQEPVPPEAKGSALSEAEAPHLPEAEEPTQPEAEERAPPEAKEPALLEVQEPAPPEAKESALPEAEAPILPEAEESTQPGSNKPEEPLQTEQLEEPRQRQQSEMPEKPEDMETPEPPVAAGEMDVDASPSEPPMRWKTTEDVDSAKTAHVEEANEQETTGQPALDQPLIASDQREPSGQRNDEPESSAVGAPSPDQTLEIASVTVEVVEIRVEKANDLDGIEHPEDAQPTAGKAVDLAEAMDLDETNDERPTPDYQEICDTNAAVTEVRGAIAEATPRPPMSPRRINQVPTSAGSPTTPGNGVKVSPLASAPAQEIEPIQDGADPNMETQGQGDVDSADATIEDASALETDNGEGMDGQISPPATLDVHAQPSQQDGEPTTSPSQDSWTFLDQARREHLPTPGETQEDDFTEEHRDQGSEEDLSPEDQIMAEIQQRSPIRYTKPQRLLHPAAASPQPKPGPGPGLTETTDEAESTDNAPKSDVLITAKSLRSRAKSKSSDLSHVDTSVSLAKAPSPSPKQAADDVKVKVKSTPTTTLRITRSSKADHADPSIHLARANLTLAKGKRRDMDEADEVSNNSPPPKLRISRSRVDLADPSVQLAKGTPVVSTRQSRSLVTPERPSRDARSSSRGLGPRANTPDTAASVSSVLYSPSVAGSSTAVQESETANALRLQLLKDLRTNLPDFLPLKKLKNSLNQAADVLAVATTTPAQPHRPKHGPRDYMLTLNLTDPSVGPRAVAVAHIFRPHQSSLPVVKAGDVVLLRRVLVVSMKGRGFGVRASEASAWAVFESGRGDSEDSLLPQIKGPPVEVVEGEVAYVEGLRRWWNLLDGKAMEKMERANRRVAEAGREEGR